MCSGKCQANRKQRAPTHTILQVGGEQREQSVRRNRGPVCEGLSARGVRYTGELRVWERQLESKAGGRCVQGERLGDCGCLKQRMAV